MGDGGRQPRGGTSCELSLPALKVLSAPRSTGAAADAGGRRSSAHPTPAPRKLTAALAVSAQARGPRQIKGRMELVRVVKRFCHQSKAAGGDSVGFIHSQPPMLTIPTQPQHGSTPNS